MTWGFSQYSLNMAKLCSFTILSSHLSTSSKLSAIRKQLIPTTTSIIPIISSESRLISLNKRFPSLQFNCTTDSSSTSSIESHQSSSMIVFVKGLSLSTSEGSLKKAFSQFGEVSRVKIVSNKRTKQSLGFAFVWFTNYESAKQAVKEMDGEFFDGRFISVTISKSGACKISERAIPYKF